MCSYFSISLSFRLKFFPEWPPENFDSLGTSGNLTDPRYPPSVKTCFRYWKIPLKLTFSNCISINTRSQALGHYIPKNSFFLSGLRQGCAQCLSGHGTRSIFQDVHMCNFKLSSIFEFTIYIFSNCTFFSNYIRHQATTSPKILSFFSGLRQGCFD